jgi:hypothetical protein
MPSLSSREGGFRLAVAAWALGIATMTGPSAVTAESVGATTREGRRAARTATIEVIGTSFTTGDGGGRAEIHSVVVGDPRTAEAHAYFWSGRFGMHGLDGTLWTRSAPESSVRWRQIILRRPRTPEEVEIVAARAPAFTLGVDGGADLLPLPFRGLAERDLARLDYIVEYFTGGTRAVLNVGATRADAEGILGHVLTRMNGL